MSRKRKKANEAVPEEILAEGSGPTQDAESLAEAANEALASAPRASDDDVVYEAKASKRRKRADVVSDEPVVDDDPTAAERESGPAPEPGAAAALEPEVQLEAAPEAKRKRSRRREVMSDELAIHAAAVNEDAALEASLAADPDVLDTEVGPELEEAELEAEQVAQADEQVLEDAVMRAEAEAELGTAEAEVAPGEEDIELSAALPTTAGTMDDLQLKHLVEALIFAADKPVTMQRLRQLTRVSDVKRLEQALATLAEDFADRGIALQQVSGGYQFRTNTQYSTWVQQLIAGRPVRLSRAQLETLAIVAYRQPITRPEVDEIRGVDSSATLRLLMDRSLIRILGKKEDVGRPILYGTTKEFLDFFSLGDLRELPTLREYSELSAESRQVMSDRLGIGPDGTPIGDDHDEAEPLDAEASAAEPPEPSVDDLVREFAEQDLSAHVGEASDETSSVLDHSSDVALSASEPADVASASDDVVASPGDVMTSASDDVVSPVDDVMASTDDVMASADDAVVSPDDVMASADDAVVSPDDVMASADDAVVSPDDVMASASDDVVSSVDDVMASTDDAVVSPHDVMASASDDVVSSADDVMPSTDDVMAPADESIEAPMQAAPNAAVQASDEVAELAANTSGDDAIEAATGAPIQVVADMADTSGDDAVEAATDAPVQVVAEMAGTSGDDAVEAATEAPNQVVADMADEAGKDGGEDAVGDEADLRSQVAADVLASKYDDAGAPPSEAVVDSNSTTSPDGVWTSDSLDSTDEPPTD